MGTAELRAALSQGDGSTGLQIDELTLHQVGGKQVVAVRGRRVDGTAFAVTSEPFDGDPIAQMRLMGMNLAVKAAGIVAAADNQSSPAPGAAPSASMTTRAQPMAAAPLQPNPPEVKMADTSAPAAAAPKGAPDLHFTGLVSGLRSDVKAAVGKAAALKARGATSLAAFAAASKALSAVYDEVDAATAEINGVLLGDGGNGGQLEQAAKNSDAPPVPAAPGAAAAS